MAAVETRVLDAAFAAMESLVNTRSELAMKSVNASFGRDPESIVFGPNQKDFH